MMRRAILAAAVCGALAACEPQVHGGTDIVIGPTSDAMSEAETEALVSQIFFEAGCTMTLNDYMDALDARGFDPALADVTTPEGHRILTNRSILESTPLLMADTDQFKRRGATLTSKIGGCADAPSSTS